MPPPRRPSDIQRPASPHDLVIALSWATIRIPYEPQLVTFTMTLRRPRRFDNGAEA